MRFSQENRKLRVSLGVFRKYHKVLSVWVGHASTRRRRTECDLYAKNRWQPNCSCSFSKTNNAIKTVVIGESKGIETKALRDNNKFFRIRRAVKKTKARVAMKFCIRRHQS